MIAEASNSDGADRGSSTDPDPSDQLASAYAHRQANPHEAAAPRPFPWFEVGIIAVVVGFAIYCGRHVKRAAESIP